MAVASELYPQIKKEKKKRKKPSPPNSNTHHSHLQPSCAYYYYFRNNLFNKNSCVSSPFPRILRSPPPFNNNLDNKNDRRAGQSAAAFSCLGSLGLRLSSPRKRWGGLAAGAGGASLRPACRPCSLRGERRAPSPLPRAERRGRGHGPRDRLEGNTGVFGPPPRPPTSESAAAQCTMGSEQSVAGKVGTWEGRGLR